MKKSYLLNFHEIQELLNPLISSTKKVTTCQSIELEVKHHLHPTLLWKSHFRLPFPHHGLLGLYIQKAFLYRFFAIMVVVLILFAWRFFFLLPDSLLECMWYKTIRKIATSCTCKDFIWCFLQSSRWCSLTFDEVSEISIGYVGYDICRLGFY